MSRPAACRLVVLASGRGSNLDALIEARDAGRLPIEIALVASDKLAARALRRAEARGIATLALSPRGHASRRDYDFELFERIAAAQPDLIILAGFMRILDPAAIEPWIGCMINIHPSLLPKYPGLHTHARVLAAGDREHGASVHFVTAELDGGPVISQCTLPVLAEDSAESLAARLLPLEHRLLVATVNLIAKGRVALVEGRVIHAGVPLALPLRLVTPGGDRAPVV